MGFRRAFSVTERALLFIATLAIVVFILVKMKIWQDGLVSYLFRVGRWGELVFVMLVVYIISHILELLLRWEFRIQARVKQR